jgi:methyl-accepting chemotaxis protein
MQDYIFKSKRLARFIAAMVLLSILGGYLLSQLIYDSNTEYLQRTEKILAMERDLSDATIALGRQIQEWKDMLLRVNDTQLFNKHKQAFFDSSSKVDNALMRTKNAMRDDGMDTGEIEEVLIEHQSLSSDYLMAKSTLNSHENNSYLEVDKLVIGIDRSLQQRIANVKSEIQKFNDLQLNEAILTQGNRNLLGILGALSLLAMSLAGYFTARRFQDYANDIAEN